MSARTPSLEILEYATARRDHAAAFGEALALLRAIDAGYGRIDSIAWRPSPVCVTETERFVEFATRFCAAFGQLLIDRDFDPSIEAFTAFVGVRRWVDTLFRIGAFGSSDHLLETIGRGAGGAEWSFEGSAPARFLMAWSPDSALRIEPGEWLAGQEMVATPTWLARIGARACLTPASVGYREELLALMARAEISLTPAMIAWIGETYLHCSYALGADKHAIKAPTICSLRELCLRAGCEEASAPPARRARPVIVVTTESFAAGHSVHRTHSRAIRGLRRDFHVVGLVRADQRGPDVDDCFDEIIDAPLGDMLESTRVAARAILDRAPDIVFHIGVGLSGRIIALAALRLAPVQCASFGHAATTMSPAIDYFVLPEDFVGAPEAFSEKIIALPRDGFPYAPRPESPSPPARDQRDAVHVAIPASLPKLNAALLDALVEIARRASREITFEFFPLGAAGLARLELAMITRAFLPAAVIYHEMAHGDYLAALARCDFFLSPFPYGNMNSIIDAIGVGLPGVCLDGDEPHARADAAILSRLGFTDDFIARDVDDYVGKATRLIDDSDALTRARELATAIDLKSSFFDGDDFALSRALLALL